MKRAEAEHLIGTRVEAWTACNGQYTGTLVGLAPTPPRHPWRGLVRIDSVLRCACVWDVTRTFKPRRGFRPDEVIEVGGSSISPTEARGVSYLEALKFELELSEKRLADEHLQDKWKFGLPQIIQRLKECIAAEEMPDVRADGNKGQDQDCTDRETST